MVETGGRQYWAGDGYAATIRRRTPLVSRVVPCAAIMRDGDEQVQATTRELRFAAIELGESPVLGRDVRLELAPGTTVLVGRNGAGKSAILERIFAGLGRAVHGGMSADPLGIACELTTQAQRLRYECRWSVHDAGENHARGPYMLVESERCVRVEPTQVEEIEAWFFASEKVLSEVCRSPTAAYPSPHTIARPKEKLLRMSMGANRKPRHSTNENRRYAELLELDACARGCPAFRDLRIFVTDLFP